MSKTLDLVGYNELLMRAAEHSKGGDSGLGHFINLAKMFLLNLTLITRARLHFRYVVAPAHLSPEHSSLTLNFDLPPFHHFHLEAVFVVV